MPRLLKRRLHDDAGFTLVESLLALFLAGVLFTSLAGVLVSAVQTSVLGRQNQQAADLMTQRVEQLRLMDHTALALTTSADDDNLVPCAGGLCLPVELNGMVSNEPLVVDPGGAVTAQEEILQSTSTNQTRFTRRTYVTAVAGQSLEQIKRVTVFVSWEQQGRTRTRSTSTLVAYTQRGLPVPVFKLQIAEATKAVNPGGRLTYKLSLANQGAPDRWDITLGGDGAGDGWTLAADTTSSSMPGGDGVYDPAVDNDLTDTSGNGVVDTGRIEPSATMVFFLTRETLSTEAESTRSVVVGATSVAQPPVAGDPDTAAGYAEVTATAIVTNSAIAPTPVTTSPIADGSEAPADCTGTGVAATKPSNGGYSLMQYALHNDPAGSTPLQERLYMNEQGADEAQLGQYSTDIAPGVTGRRMSPFSATEPDSATVLASADSTSYADWSYQTSRSTALQGTAVVRIWVARAEAGTSPVSLKAVLFTGNSSGTSFLREMAATGQVSVASLACPGFQEVFIPITVPSTAVGKNAWFGVRVVAYGVDPVRLAYDVPAGAQRAYPASLTIGVK